MTEQWASGDNDLRLRANWAADLKKFHKKEFRALMQSVELDPRFTTPDQVERAKGLIMDGYAMNADEAYSHMVQEATSSKSKHYTEY